MIEQSGFFQEEDFESEAVHITDEGVQYQNWNAQRIYFVQV